MLQSFCPRPSVPTITCLHFYTADEFLNGFRAVELYEWITIKRLERQRGRTGVIFFPSLTGDTGGKILRIHQSMSTLVSSRTIPFPGSTSLTFRGRSCPLPGFPQVGATGQGNGTAGSPARCARCRCRCPSSPRCPRSQTRWIPRRCEFLRVCSGDRCA